MAINYRVLVIKKCHLHIKSYTFFINKNPSIFNIYVVFIFITLICLKIHYLRVRMILILFPFDKRLCVGN